MSPVSDLLVITDDDGDELVLDIGPGIVSLVANEPGVMLRGQKLDLLREALDRAAMPGQAAEPAGRGRVLAACRSCSAAIEWGKDPAGKRVPVDADGRADGNLAVQEAAGGGPLHVRYLRKDGVLTHHEWRATSHFATCPDAAKWRERGAVT